jgi:hypothetical protein
MKIKFLLFLSFALILCSCAPQYRIRSEAKIDTLNLCMRYSESYPDSLKAVFDKQASDFIAKFNKYEHAFYMSMGDDTTRSALVMDIKDIYIVGRQYQEMTVFVTAVGIATCTYLIMSGAPFWLIFWMVPLTTTNLQLKLSPDLTRSVDPLFGRVRSGALFRSKKSQIKCHQKEFYHFLSDQIDYIEEQYNMR